MTDNVPPLLAVLALILGAMISPIANTIWRKVMGAEYATKTDCNKKHEQMNKDCQACKAATSASICSIRHEAEKNHKLLLLIAIRLRIPAEELKDYM